MLASPSHFVAIAAASQWDEAAIALDDDAAAWPRLPGATRERIAALVAAFQLGETVVATELTPFAAGAADPDAATAFAAQQADETRHARFFDRVAREVTGAGTVAPAFAELFEQRLPQLTARLAAGDVALAEAVGLYHLLLEGVVFSAGQSALLALLDGADPPLDGTRRGVELVVRDERWHIGFGARLLQQADIGDAAAAQLAGEADTVLAAWGGGIDTATVEHACRLHRRRMRAAGLLPAGVAGDQAPSTSRSSPPRTPLATFTS